MAFLYLISKSIWKKTFTDHPRNEIRNQALSRSRFSLIFDRYGTFVIYAAARLMWKFWPSINSCTILHMHSHIRQIMFDLISAQLDLHLLINQTIGVYPIAGQFTWNIFFVVLWLPVRARRERNSIQ